MRLEVKLSKEEWRYIAKQIKENSKRDLSTKQVKEYVQDLLKSYLIDEFGHPIPDVDYEVEYAE